MKYSEHIFNDKLKDYQKDILYSVQFALYSMLQNPIKNGEIVVENSLLQKIHEKQKTEDIECEIVETKLLTQF